ncbi:MAG: hypothetical protein V1790_09775 [Planctomycetota bacterium]
MKSNPDNELAGVILAAFKVSGLSVKRLAVESGVPYASAHGFIAGQRDITLGTAARLCKVLGLRLTTRKGRIRK